MRSAVLLLFLVACLPPTYTVTADVFDIGGQCWDTNVVITLDTKYWREWYVLELDGDEGPVPTSDGRCVVLPGCTEELDCIDKPPLVADDPNFTQERDAVVSCTKAWRGDIDWAPCSAPYLTAWPE